MSSIFRVALLFIALFLSIIFLSASNGSLEGAISDAEIVLPLRTEQLVVTPLEGVVQLTVNQQGREKGTRGDRSGMTRVIVELDAPSLVAFQRSMRELVELDSAESQVILNEIAQGQDEILAQISSGRGDISAEYRYSTLFNGFSIDIPSDHIEEISQIAGIKRLYPQHIYHLQMDASLQQIGTTAAWTAAGGANNAGKGVKVAVIDSGINPTSPLFSPQNFNAPAGFPKGDCTVNGTVYCSGKVIVARWYGENGGIPTGSINLEEASPRDVLGHGSHVAGVAVGNFGGSGTVADVGDGIVEVISGVAPGAWLMVYKACWNGASCPGDGLLMALEDAVNDGADIINNSWGGGPGDDPADSPFKTAIENATAAGVSIIFAAGNNGRDANTIACPACVEETIAVSNVTSNRVHANSIEILVQGSNSQIVTKRIALPGRESPQTSGIYNRPIFFAGQINAGNDDACDGFGGTFTGGPIILAHRGNCTFSTKVTNVQNAGGSALLLINNIGGPPTQFSVNNAIGIPAFMFSQVDGTTILNAVLAQSSAHANLNPISREVNSAWADLMYGTSSRGPNGDPDVLKPDIAAPGSNILSGWTTAFGGTGFGLASGTSMAAPHVAGAAALLLQQNPTWTPQQVKSALMNSTTQNNLYKEFGSPEADAFDVGAGRLDLAQMSQVGLTFDHASYANSGCLVECSWQNTLRNESDKTVTWQASVEAPDGTRVSVVPATITLAAGESKSFSVHIDVAGFSSDDWQFAGVRWEAIDHSDLTDAWLPIVFVAQPGMRSETFDKSAETPSPIHPGDTITYTISLANPFTSTRSFLISDTLPAGLTFLNNVGSPPVNYNPGTRTVTANTTALMPTLSLSSGDYGGYIELLSINPNLEPLECTGLCDDDWFSVPGLDFEFMGEHYDTLYVSANGLLSLNPFLNSANQPQRLPDAIEPNHLIAPLWSDFDLEGSDGDSVGGGKIYGSQVSNSSGSSWNVIEWKDAQHYGNPSVVHSFQLWIQRGTDNMWFTFGRLDNFATYASTIGVESRAGDIGTTWFHKQTLGATNEGTLPTTSDDVFLTIHEPIEYKFAVRVDSGVFVDNTAIADDGSNLLVATTQIRVGEQVFLPIIIK